MRCQTVILDHPQHVFFVLVILRKGTNFAGDFGRCGIGHTRHQRSDRRTDCPAFIAVIGMTLRHQ